MACLPAGLPPARSWSTGKVRRLLHRAHPQHLVIARAGRHGNRQGAALRPAALVRLAAPPRRPQRHLRRPPARPRRAADADEVRPRHRRARRRPAPRRRNRDPSGRARPSRYPLSTPARQALGSSLSCTTTNPRGSEGSREWS